MIKYFIFSFLLLTACSSNESKWQEFFELGNNALDAGKYDEAIAHFTNSIKIKSTFPEAYNNRGVAHMESGNPYEAIQDYNQALILQSDYVACQLNRAYAYEAIGQYDNALEDLGHLLELKPDSAFLHFYNGVLQSRTRAYELSMKSFQRSMQLGYDSVEPLINMATIHYFGGRYREAKHVLAKVEPVSTGQPEVWSTLSQIYLEQDSLEEALYHIERALHLRPEDPYFLNNRGLIYLEMGRLHEGLADINASILADPSNGWAYRNKGIYYLKGGNLDRAIVLFERAIAANEFIEPLYGYLAEAYWQKNETAKACELVSKARVVGERISVEWQDRCP